MKCQEGRMGNKGVWSDNQNWLLSTQQWESKERESQPCIVKEVLQRTGKVMNFQMVRKCLPRTVGLQTPNQSDSALDNCEPLWQLKIICPVTISSSTPLQDTSLPMQWVVWTNVKRFLVFICLGAKIISAGSVAVEIRGTASQGRVESWVAAREVGAAAPQD